MHHCTLENMTPVLMVYILDVRWMSKEEKHLQTKIRIFEDMLLRCKNFGQAEAIQIELTRMRAKLQKLYFKRMES